MTEKTSPETGGPAPDFNLPDQNENSVSLENFRGKWIVLYFYPKDNTSGCTLEALDFTCSVDKFTEHNAVIIGVSPDSVKSHNKFIDKHSLNINLLSDPEHTVLEKYGAWGPKKMYGREYMGVVRSTFLIDPEGKVRQVWKKVKVKGHVETILAVLTEQL